MKFSLLTGVSVLAIASSAFAQSSVDRFERQLQQIQQQTRQKINADVPASQRALVDYGGYVSMNVFAIDDQEQDTHILFEPDIVGYARVNFDGAHELFFRARGSYRDFYQSNSFDSSGDTSEGVIELAYYKFDLARYLATQGKTSKNDLTVTAGRQFVNWGNGLTLAQYLDGITADLTLGNVEISTLAGVTVPALTIDFDASRRSFNDHTTRGFYGLMAATQMGVHRPYIYGLIQRDYNSDDPFMYTSGAENRFEYNSWYIGAGSNGSFGDHLVYAAEIAYEGGDTLSNPFILSSGVPTPIDQTEENISAAAADFRLDYVVGDPNHTKFTFETVLGTGSTDRFNSTSSTFGGIMSGNNDHAFNALGMINTGLAFSPQVSNIMVFHTGASTFPFTSKSLKRLQLGADLFVYGKFNSQAPVDEPTSSDWFLGWEPDLSLNWQITSDLSLAMRYGVFFPGSAIESDDHPRNFFFCGVTYSF